MRLLACIIQYTLVARVSLSTRPSALRGQCTIVTIRKGGGYGICLCSGASTAKNVEHVGPAARARSCWLTGEIVADRPLRSACQGRLFRS